MHALAGMTLVDAPCAHVCPAQSTAMRSELERLRERAGRRPDVAQLCKEFKMHFVPTKWAKNRIKPRVASGATTAAGLESRDPRRRRFWHESRAERNRVYQAKPFAWRGIGQHHV